MVQHHSTCHRRRHLNRQAQDPLEEVWIKKKKKNRKKALFANTDFKNRHPTGNALPKIEGEEQKDVIASSLIPKLKIMLEPFSAELLYPPTVVVGEPFIFRTKITNHRNRIEEFSFAIKASDHFLVSGCQTSAFKVIPQSSYEFNHT